MGLDMYLEKMPRYKDTAVKNVLAYESYLDWLDAKKDGSEYANCDFKKWSGYEESDLPDEEARTFYKKFYKMRYYAWDTERKYGHKAIVKQIGYWRKANAIHNWFVQNVQNGVDDCGTYIVTKENLEELLYACNVVVDSSKLVNDKIVNGYKSENGKMVPCIEEGQVIVDSSVAENMLPSCDGFFFGGTAYDEYYLQDIKDTVKMLKKVIKDADFDSEMIYYQASW